MRECLHLSLVNVFRNVLLQLNIIKIVVSIRAESKLIRWDVRTDCQMDFENIAMCSVQGCPLVNVFRNAKLQRNTLENVVANWLPGQNNEFQRFYLCRLRMAALI